MMTAQAHSPTLVDLVLGYEHAGLLERIQEKLHKSADQAQELFVDMLMFLYLAGMGQGSLVPAEEIDEAWHHFILFTADYERFCLTHFGRFIHHRPFTQEERASLDGSLGRRTLTLAEATFGKPLSANWHSRAGDCNKCQGSTNCNGGNCSPQ